VALGGSAARRYAEAMLGIAAAEGGIAACRSAFDLLAGVDRSALRMLRDPSVPLERHARIAEHAEGAPIHASEEVERRPAGGDASLSGGDAEHRLRVAAGRRSTERH